MWQNTVTAQAEIKSNDKMNVVAANGKGKGKQRTDGRWGKDGAVCVCGGSVHRLTLGNGQRDVKK